MKYSHYDVDREMNKSMSLIKPGNTQQPTCRESRLVHYLNKPNYSKNIEKMMKHQFCKQNRPMSIFCVEFGI